MRSRTEAKAYLLLLFARLGGIAVAAVALNSALFQSQLRSIWVGVFLTSFLLAFLASVVSIGAGVLRSSRSMSIAERLGYYVSLGHIDEAATLIGAQSSAVRRWTRALILAAVLAIGVGAIHAVLFTG